MISPDTMHVRRPGLELQVIGSRVSLIGGAFDTVGMLYKAEEGGYRPMRATLTAFKAHPGNSSSASGFKDEYGDHRGSLFPGGSFGGSLPIRLARVTLCPWGLPYAPDDISPAGPWEPTGSYAGRVVPDPAFSALALANLLGHYHLSLLLFEQEALPLWIADPEAQVDASRVAHFSLLDASPHGVLAYQAQVQIVRAGPSVVPYALKASELPTRYLMQLFRVVLEGPVTHPEATEAMARAELDEWREDERQSVAALAP